MVSNLDPHSSYMDAKNFRDMQMQTKGEFGGLGIEVTMEDGLVKVISPIDDTPAAKAGIKAGDHHRRDRRRAMQGLTLNEAIDKMRGRSNTKITLTILRKAQDKPFDVTLDARRHPGALGDARSRRRYSAISASRLQRADRRA